MSKVCANSFAVACFRVGDYAKTSVRPKDSVDPAKKDGVVYRIPCECCKVYIGETESYVLFWMGLVPFLAC